ncbi:MAG TPA: nitrite reductase large subunit NirB, partial [Polyangiaceae bacterium]
VAVVPADPDGRVVEVLARKEATVRALAHTSGSDGIAGQWLDLLLRGGVDCAVWSAPSQVEQVWDVARTRGAVVALTSALGACRVVAIGDAVAIALRQRGVRVDECPQRVSFVRPRLPELAVLLGVRGEASTSAPDSDPSPPAALSARDGKRTVVVIGNGMVGYKFCERLSETAGDKFEIVAFCEESRPAYDRVHLTSYFEKQSADELSLATLDWYKQRGIRLLVGERALKLDRKRRLITSTSGERIVYDVAVFATGSVPFVPPIPGVDKRGVFVYRTIDDLDAIREYAKRCKSAVVLGGGLLGLEAAKAVHDLGLATEVVEFAPRLMPRQLDMAGARLLGKSIEALGVRVHLNRSAARIVGEHAVESIEFSQGEPLQAEMVIVSAGIRPRDELARHAGVAVGERGGIIVDDELCTSERDVYAIGECALHRGTIYGLVSPGYQMAEALAKNLSGVAGSFKGGDQSAKLKLLGVDVASLGDPFADATGARSIVYEDLVKGVYKKLVISGDKKRLLGGVLVGDASDYANLLQVMRSGAELSESPETLIFGDHGGQKRETTYAEEAQICSCNNVSKGDICALVRGGCTNLGELKTKSRAGTGCGGCLPLVTDIVNAELRAAGKLVKSVLCEHFKFTRQELYEIVKVTQLKSFEALLSSHGKGAGCEVCKPTVASILASVHNEWILNHSTLQDTNDRYLANIQRGGLYSIVPRVPAGEITPQKLIRIGEIAQKYGLYTKITGGQRIDLFGAQLNQLPDIWEELVESGFESGHAYGKSMRTVKSCVGSTWCRFGVQDSVAFALRVENRYKGIRSPHKLKSAVSGCIRECAEAQSKDFGIIATDKGWNVYVCGNGGAKPRHADLLVADIDGDSAIRYLDRFIMFYIKTADRLTRTSTWLDKLEGGIDYLRDVVINDRLGIAAELERDMQHLVDTYRCEWAEAVKDPSTRARFRHYANSGEFDESVELVEERGQRRPKDWLKAAPAPVRARIHLPLITTSWVNVGRVAEFPAESGHAIKYGAAQIAVFNFASRGQWYACQNMCPHKQDMVLARGLIGDQSGVPKVACPQHKKTFALDSGECLSGDAYKVRTFPVKIENGVVFLELPSVSEVEKLLVVKVACATDACAAE